MDCTCEKHDHRGPLDESTENCVVDGCSCGVAPDGYVVPNTNSEKGYVPAAGHTASEDDKGPEPPPIEPTPEPVVTPPIRRAPAQPVAEPVGEPVADTPTP